LPQNPLFLSTAVEAVVRAGGIQMAKFGGDFRVDKKGAIDLVTEVDVEVERMFRALVAERFPDHQVLAEELGGQDVIPTGPCWIFDPIDGTTNFTHGLPIFCCTVGVEEKGNYTSGIDVGGESTRPGAEPVSLDEELGRVMPVLERLAGGGGPPLSIDTSKARVAEAAIRAGVMFVNDVTALRGDPEMAGVVAYAVIYAVALIAWQFV